MFQNGLRSDYVPYPYNPKTKLTSDHKVVRGGSYIERPEILYRLCVRLTIRTSVYLT